MTTSAPFFRIDSIGKGFLAVMAHPAREGDVEMMIRELAAQGVQQVVSLLDPDEARELGLENEAELVNEQSMDFVSFPIRDMGLPGSVDDFARLSKNLFHQVEVGINKCIFQRDLFKTHLLHIKVSRCRTYERGETVRQVRTTLGPTGPPVEHALTLKKVM